MSPNPNVPKHLYSVAEVQAVTGLSRTKVYELIGTGELEATKVGRLRKIPAEALDDWLRTLRPAVH